MTRKAEGWWKYRDGGKETAKGGDGVGKKQHTVVYTHVQTLRVPRNSLAGPVAICVDYTLK